MMINKILDDQEDATIDRLLGLIDKSPTAFHAADQLMKICLQAGFTPLTGKESLKPGDCCFLTVEDSAFFAIKIGENPLSSGFRMVGTHLDAPALKIKPNSLIQQEGVWLLNTELYGSPILTTWFDRPLSIAGRVLIDSGNPLSPEARLIDFRRPLLVIPNVAIHLNPTVNDEQKIKPQQMMLPIIALADGGNAASHDLLTLLIASELSVEPERLLDADLYLYECTPGTRLGLNNEFIQTGRLDNLGLAYAAVTALTESHTQTGINLVACFDHEEVGSRTSQGAIGMTLRDLLERIVINLGGSRETFLDRLSHSFLISADQAHAAHPNFADRSDPTNRPRINQGPVIKFAANRAYTTDGVSAAVFRKLCQAADVPCQTYVNRSDVRGGSTIGPLFVEHLPVKAVDVGNPIWGMHAIRETGGVSDQIAMARVLRHFFELA